MYIQHAAPIWRDFPQLAVGVIHVDGIIHRESVDDRVTTYHATARTRLDGSRASDFAEIQAWRRAFSAMGLKPTQYRCASESLLRRFAKNDDMPSIHPLIDLCNAVSLAFAIPVAVFDVSAVGDGLEVRYATGAETYLTFSGTTEHPAPGEVIFADGDGRAHARRWTNRQSGLSAVQDTTATALIVAEALHDSARADVQRLTAALQKDLASVWSVTPDTAMLTAAAPRYEP